MRHRYRTQGTCAIEINFDIDGGVVTNVEFTSGCDGNLKAIPRLIEGWKATDIVERLQGLTCGGKATSCGDQLAAALRQALQP